MIKGLGIDIEEVSEIKKSVENENFKKLIFTEREISYCEKKKIIG